VGSRDFTSGVHSWVVEIVESVRMAVGVGRVDSSSLVFVEESKVCWNSTGSAEAPCQSLKSLGSYSKGDSIRLVLDMNKATLTFYKNVKFAGFFEGVTGHVRPCLLLYSSGGELALKDTFTSIQQEASTNSQGLIFACSRMIRNTVAVLTSFMESTATPSAALQNVCASVLDTLLERLCLLFKMLCTHASSDLLVLSVLDQVDGGFASSTAQYWLQSTLTCLLHIQDPQLRRRLLPRIHALARSGTELLQACPYLQCYQGTATLGYSLRGWSFLPSDQQAKSRHLRIVQSATFDGNWTLEFVLMCTRRPNEQGRRVLSGTRDFSIVFAPGDGADHVQLHVLEGNPESDNQAPGLGSSKQKTRTVFSEVKCPINRWMVLSLVSKAEGSTSVFVNGNCVGTANDKFNLSLLSIGACTHLTKPFETFSGQVRECRVYAAARSSNDILRWESLSVFVCDALCLEVETFCAFDAEIVIGKSICLYIL
jgi:hypothetical protein